MDAEPDRHPPHIDMTIDKTFDCSYPDSDYKSLWTENVGCHERGLNPTQQGKISSQVSSQHSNKLFCPRCLFIVEDSTDFKAHILAHSGTQPVSTIPSTSRNVGSFNAQMLKSSRPQTTTGTRKFCCGICFKCFNNGSNLSRHKKNIHYSSNPVANSVTKLVGFLDDAQEPRKDPEFVKPTAADVTSAIASVDETQREWMIDLLIEELNIEGETFYGCTICRHKTKRRRNLMGHLLVHTDHRPFGCPMKDCTYRAKSLKNLKTHSLVHTDHRPFGCPMKDCRYRGKSLRLLQQHSRLTHRVDLPAQKKAKIAEENLRRGMDCDNQTDVDSNCSNFSMAFACMLCEFIGNSELAALEHAQNHKTSSF